MATLEELEARYGLNGNKPSIGNTVIQQPSAPVASATPETSTAPLMPQIPKGVPDPLRKPVDSEPLAPLAPRPLPSSTLPPLPSSDPIAPVQDDYLTDRARTTQSTTMSPQTKAAIGGMDKSYNEMTKASTQVANAAAAENTQKAEHAEVVAKYKQGIEEEKVAKEQVHQEEVSKRLGEIDSYSKQLVSEQPKGFWEDKSTLQRMGLAIAVVLGNIGDAMAGGRGDTGNQMLQGIMDKETQGQQERYKQARQRIADMKVNVEAKENLYMKLEQQNDAVTLAKLGAYEAHLGKLATETQNTTLKAKLKEEAAKVGASYQKEKVQVAQKYDTAISSTTTNREQQVAQRKPVFETADKLQDWAAKDPSLSETKAATKLRRTLAQAVNKEGNMTAIQASKFISAAEGLAAGSYGADFAASLQTSLLGSGGFVETLKAWATNKKDGENFAPPGLTQAIVKYSNDLTKAAFTNPALESSYSIVNDSEKALFGGKTPMTAGEAAQPVIVRQGNTEKVVSYGNYIELKKRASDIKLVGIHGGK